MQCLRYLVSIAFNYTDDLSNLTAPTVTTTTTAILVIRSLGINTLARLAIKTLIPRMTILEKVES